MCGINGIVYYDEVQSDDLQKDLQVMLDLTKHRGPDNSQKILLNRAALGENRLAIVGVNNTSVIYTSPDKSQYMLFNGEIVNYRALARQFHLPIDNNTSDSAVILPLHAQLGPGFARTLAGMFAIAIYDSTLNRLQLWRDPLGIKPLYYCRTTKAVIFSSEIKAICSVLDYPPEIDFSALDHILRLRFHPGRSTVFSIIQRVLPGETVIFEASGISHEFYWNPNSNGRLLHASYENLVEEFRGVLKQVIAEQSQANVSGGMFVSGGIDSSIVTKLAMRSNSSYRTPISIRFLPEPTSDESFGLILEKEMNLSFEWVTISDSDAQEAIKEIVAYLDEPLENPIHVGTYLMAKRARDLGIKTVLTGDGSDEFFLGYERHTCWFNPSISDPSSEYARWLWTLMPEQASELYTPQAKELVKPAMDSEGQPIEPFRSIDQALTFEQRERLPEYHCMRLDRMTMAFAVEARVPFLDHRIVDFAQRIPLSILFGKSGKAFLREAAKEWLPQSIITRPKVHFPSLPDQWLKYKGGSWVSDILLDPNARTRRWFNLATLEHWIHEHQTGQRNHGRILWACLVLELWLNQVWVPS
jgi:asparagine synthase (glutamine-hydrolysing)